MTVPVTDTDAHRHTFSLTHTYTHTRTDSPGLPAAVVMSLLPQPLGLPIQVVIAVVGAHGNGALADVVEWRGLGFLRAAHSRGRRWASRARPVRNVRRAATSARAMGVYAIGAGAVGI